MTDGESRVSGNRLGSEPSPFLQHGATQPVHWRAWGEDAFREAKALGRPVLLDIGAVWCHWCHVMDHESYDNADTAAVINALYVPVKVDRDERPDVDARYQRAVQLLTGQGGWPLTAFLTPDGDVFYGGTYFPPDEGHGRPSFRRVLTEAARIWTQEPERALDAVRSIEDRTRSFAQSETRLGEVSPSIPDQSIEELADTFDFRHGGFGRAPKFPNPGGLDLVLDRFMDSGDEWARRIVLETLTAMGRGGIFDQLGGGFHRYSTDARWIVPHFEKMAYDNGPLLATCAAAAAALDEPFLAGLADGIIAHYLDIAPELLAQGGFPASQDADFGFDNDGDYWTWTLDEMRAVLPAEDDFELARIAYGLDDDGGRMHIDRSRHVLFRPTGDAGLAERIGTDIGEAKRRLDHVRARLRTVRDERRRPYVDDTLYSGWTALVASGHLRAARYLGRDEAGKAGLRAIERIRDEALVASEGIVHRVGDPASGFMLDDQAYTLDAMIDAFEYAQDARWLEHATLLASILAGRFRDAETGALRDRPAGDAPVRSLEEPLFPITDSPTASGNGAAALALMRLAALTGDAGTLDVGAGILRAFAGAPARLLAAAATYAKAVTWAVHPVTTVVVVDRADRPAESDLFRTALRTYRPRTVIRLLTPADVDGASLPDALRAMVQSAHPRAYVCAGHTCAAPVDTVEALASLLRSFRGS
jgi:hypothetical protein